MDGCFKKYPDIFALPTPSKLKRKKHLKYLIEEMPKDPLDVTFGNDSGCCIFVDDDVKKTGNGMFVPYYLVHPGVRLFGVYRTEKSRRQRMGLVVAFETEYADKRKGKILACNSLELSILGLAGGETTISRLVDYVEGWLVEYAKQNGYVGVCMGGHSYNTSLNYSSRKNDVVKDTLVFSNSPLFFYSDIFRADDDRSMLTRDHSCYWLWKKEH